MKNTRVCSRLDDVVKDVERILKTGKVIDNIINQDFKEIVVYGRNAKNVGNYIVGKLKKKGIKFINIRNNKEISKYLTGNKKEIFTLYANFNEINNTFLENARSTYEELGTMIFITSPKNIGSNGKSFTIDADAYLK